MKRGRVLVTGVTGFIGSHVASSLAASGWSVIGHGRSAGPAAGDADLFGFPARHGGALTPALLARIAQEIVAVVHCAGSGLVSTSLRDPMQDHADNVGTLQVVLEHLRVHAPGARLVMLSSAAVYGRSLVLPISETTLCQPVSPYGTHKQMAEILCESYARHFALDVAVLRLFSIYGNGLRKQLLWDACGKLRQGRSEFFGTGDELRDWLHVDDVCRLVSVMLDRPARGLLVCNGGSGIGVAVRDVISHLATVLGVEQSIGFSGVARTGDPPGFVADISRAVDLGWRPAVGWREGMRAYALDYLAAEEQS